MFQLWNSLLQSQSVVLLGGEKKKTNALSWTEYRSAKLESTFPRELANSIFVKSRQLEKAFRGRIR